MDITINGTVPRTYEITGTPTLLFFKNGRQVNRTVGFVPEGEIVSRIEYMLGG